MSTKPAWLKPAVDFGPLAAFMATYYLAGMAAATMALMGVTALALAVSWIVTRKVAMMPLVTAVIVGVFGGLTLWLHDDSFIQMKPTIVYAMFAVVLAFGVISGRPLLKSVLGEALDLDDVGWRRLSIRFLLFFAAMAVANEIVRRVASMDMWVLWKVPGAITITLVFMLAQAPLIQRHRQISGQEG